MLALKHLRRSALILAVTVLVGASTVFFWSRAQAGLETAPLQSAASAQWSGAIVIQNDGAAPATAVVNFYSQAGVLVKSYSLPDTIPAKGSRSVDTESIDGLPNGFAGSAVVSASQPVSASFVGFDVTNPDVNQTIYNGFSGGSDSVYVPEVSHNYADQTSTLAVQNVDSVPATVVVRFFERFTGIETAVLRDTIPPNASHFYDAGNLPSGQRLPAPWTGAALVQSRGGRVAAAVHQPYLSSNKAVSFEGSAAIGSEIYLPSALYQYAPQRQTTFISVQNTSGNAVTATITFYSSNGAQVGSATATIEPFQKQSWNPGSAGIPPEFNGTAVVRASGPVVAVANITSATDLSLAYTGAARGALKQSLPYIRWAPSTNAKGWRTYVAVMNTDQTLPSDITIRYYDESGTLIHAPSFKAVPPNSKVNHHPGLFLDEDRSFAGAIEIESNRAAIGLVNAITVDGTQAESYTSAPIR